MPGGSGTTIVGWDSNTESGNLIVGTPSAAGSITATQLAAVASDTPDTAWLKVATADTDLILCVWDASTGTLLVESNILTAASQNPTSGVWNSVSLASTSALVNGTTYVIGIQQHGNYWNVRQSSGATKYWQDNAPATWPTPSNPISGYVFGNNDGQWSFYFSKEGAGTISIPQQMMMGVGS